jgi:hypothetical protein
MRDLDRLDTQRSLEGAELRSVGVVDRLVHRERLNGRPQDAGNRFGNPLEPSAVPDVLSSLFKETLENRTQAACINSIAQYHSALRVTAQWDTNQKVGGSNPSGRTRWPSIERGSNEG